MTYGEKFQLLIDAAQNDINEADKAATSFGDLWHSYEHLTHAAASIEAATDLIRECSKVAFERVFKEKA